MRLKKIFSKDWTLYCIISAIALFIFIGIYGIRILNPVYVDWLLEGGDLPQHYLGWCAYRESAWHFPIGMTDNLAYPHLTSIIFTDSIPIFAFIFKLLSPILPSKFQYFGLWGVLCFVLQGIFTAQIVKKYTSNRLVIILCSVLAIFTPVMIRRLHGHAALGGQWLLIYALGMIINRRKYDNKKIYINCGILAFLSASIHIYFVLMNGIMMVGCCLTDILEKKRIGRTIVILSEYIMVAAITVGLFGGFSSGMDAQNGGLGIYSINLNTFFNPQGWSRLLRDLPTIGYGQYDEGLGYLGIGFLFLTVIWLVLLIGKLNLKTIFVKHWKLLVPLTVVFLTGFVVALSPVISFGDKTLMVAKLPKFVTAMWSVFRASGRVVWVCTYIIEAIILITLIKGINTKRVLITILCIATVLQVLDLSNMLSQRHKYFSVRREYDSELDSKEFWNSVSENETIKHLIYYDKPEQRTYYSLTDWALKNDITVSDFYFARSLSNKINESKNLSLKELSENDIFIFPEKDVMDCSKYDLNYYHIDNLIVGYVNEISDLSPMNNEFSKEWVFSDNQFINSDSGLDTENGREIYPEGISFGPYWSLPKGYYFVSIMGQDIPEELAIMIYSDHGNKNHNYNILERSPQEIKMKLVLEEDVSDLEIVLENKSDRSSYVYSISLLAFE